MEDISNNEIDYDRLEQGYNNMEAALLNLMGEYEELHNFRPIFSFLMSISAL